MILPPTATLNCASTGTETVTDSVNGWHECAGFQFPFLKTRFDFYHPNPGLGQCRCPGHHDRDGFRNLIWDDEL